MISRAKMNQPKPALIELVPASKCPLWVKSVALCNGWLRLDFRYAPFATEFVSRCNMSRRERLRCKIRETEIRGAATTMRNERLSWLLAAMASGLVRDFVAASGQGDWPEPEPT